MTVAHDLMPDIIYSVLLAACIAVRYAYRSFKKSKKVAPTFTENSVGAPGHLWIEKIDALKEDLIFNKAFVITIPLVVCSGYAVHIYFYRHAFEPLALKIFGALGAVITLYYLIRVWKLQKKCQFMQLRYEGALAVGQELDQLKLKGDHVYHDFPADKFNIDHLVVGRKGIFTVVTNASSRPINGDRRREDTVEYNGKMIHFPNGDDFTIIEQAEWQASWLSQWISDVIGEQVAARAIVALPGWYVKRTSAEGISVVNPKQFPSLFKHIKPRPLPDETIARIVTELEQKSRKVTSDPKAPNGRPPKM